ncbi:hypothetical protein ACQEWB_42340 [Streptomyces sp. CA-249302]|uniref:hypothetical protein n=1 Tax=Streptomyces sp. CA-249302 TaxID=3240058 RepID=UPI003D8C8FBF
MTKVERKIASRLTIMVSRPKGYGSQIAPLPNTPSLHAIHTANHRAWRYTNVIVPENAVMASAMRSWVPRMRTTTSCSCVIFTDGRFADEPIVSPWSSR